MDRSTHLELDFSLINTRNILCAFIPLKLSSMLPTRYKSRIKLFGFFWTQHSLPLPQILSQSSLSLILQINALPFAPFVH